MEKGQSSGGWRLRIPSCECSMCAGTRSVEIGVDEDGFIFLGYDAGMDDEAEFIWRKNYTEPIDSSRAHEETKAEGYSCIGAHSKPAGMLFIIVLT